jgi:hypothetical protein
MTVAYDLFRGHIVAVRAKVVLLLVTQRGKGGIEGSAGLRQRTNDHFP